MEEAAELANYLPLSFKTLKDQEYIEFLWDAFETNYTNKKFQFAFLAYHMLTMSFIYFNIWQIKQTEPKDFAMGLIVFGKDIEKSLLEANSPFVFSTVNERTILRFLKLIDGLLCTIFGKQVSCYQEFLETRNRVFRFPCLHLELIAVACRVICGSMRSNAIGKRFYERWPLSRTRSLDSFLHNIVNC